MDHLGHGTHTAKPQRQGPHAAQHGTCGFPAGDKPEWQITVIAIL